ncbi:MAG: FliG C-terminal domain-containing protein, partial [Planctomycetaceae bacterium]
SFGSQRHRVTATIGIKPRPGIQLTDDQIEMLRQVVAGGVPDLVSDDVVIFDQSALTDSSLPVSSRMAPDGKTVQRGQQPDVSSVDMASSEPQEISIPAWLMPLLIVSSLVGLVLIVTSLRRRVDVPARLAGEEMIPAWVDDMSQRIEVDEEGFETVPGEDLSESISTETEHSAVDELAVDESSDSLPDAVETSGDVVGEAAEVVAVDAGGRLEFLTNAQPSLLAGWLTDEHPQVAAVIVSELPEGFGVEVLSRLSAELREDLESRLSGGITVHEDVLVDLAETLKDRWRDAESRLLHDTLAPHETRSTAATRGWSNSELALLQAVEGILARFDDLIGVESSIIRAVYDLVGPHPFRQALSGSDIEIRRAVLNRLTPLARMELARQIEQQDPVRLADINRSQHEILKHTRRLLAAADPSWLAEGA